MLTVMYMQFVSLMAPAQMILIVLEHKEKRLRERIAFTLNYHDLQISNNIVGRPYNHFIQTGCRDLGFSILSEHETENLKLHPPFCFHHPASLLASIYLKDCPPGFELIENSCKCNETIYKVTGHRYLCNSSTGLIKWTG